MNGPEQLKLKRMGDEGCYLIDLKKGADIFNHGDNTVDILALYDLLTTTIIQSKDGPKPIMDEDCYLNYAALALGVMTGVRWSLEHGPADYKPRHGEIVIVRYAWKEINKVWSHFVLHLEDGTIYDPLGNSRTVLYGKAVSTRIFRRVL